MKEKRNILSKDLQKEVMDMPLKTVLSMLAMRVMEKNLDGGILRVNSSGFTFDIKVSKNNIPNQQTTN